MPAFDRHAVQRANLISLTVLTEGPLSKNSSMGIMASREGAAGLVEPKGVKGSRGLREARSPIWPQVEQRLVDNEVQRVNLLDTNRAPSVLDKHPGLAFALDKLCIKCQ